MIKTIDARVYQQIHFPDTPVVEICKAVQDRFGPSGAKAYPLCRDTAMAVLFTGLPIDRSALAESVRQTELGTPVASFIHGFLDKNKPASPCYDPLTLWVPDCKFELSVWLAPGETSGRFIHTGWEPKHGYWGQDIIVYKLIYRKKISHKLSVQIRELLRRWHEESTNAGFGEERLNQSPLSISEDDEGMIFTLQDYRPVTFPWIELYLRLRSGISRQQWPMEMLYRAVGDKRVDVIERRTNLTTVDEATITSGL